MNILIFTAKFGMGHWSAAESLAADITRQFPAAKIEILDVLSTILPAYHDKVYQSFNQLVSRGGSIYNIYYKFSETGDKPLRISQIPFGDLFTKVIAGILKEKKPDYVFSTIPLASDLVSACKEKNIVRMPLITCITDISLHHEWFHPGTNFYLVGSTSMKKEMMGRGIPASRIFVYGIPVRADFQERAPREASSKERHLLIMGGGLGLMPVNEEQLRAIDQIPNLQTIIITGKNEDAYQMVSGRYQNIKAVGYTNKVASYMEWADLIFSKPGGITLFEAIHTGVPMFVIKPFLQQEIKNAHFIEASGIGTVYWKEPRSLPKRLEKLLANEGELERMRRNMKVLLSELQEDALTAIVKPSSVQTA